MPRLPTTSAAMPGPDIQHPHLLLERAVKAEIDGHPDVAIMLYRSVLDLEPTNLRALNRLGAAAGASGDLTTAVRQLRNSIRIDPNQPETWFNLGVAQSRLGLSEEALTSFECSIALTPLSGSAHLYRGATLTRLGRYRDAVMAFDETMRLLPDDPVVALYRGIALQWCGEYDHAFREFDRAIALKPDMAEGWVSKAALMLMLGDLSGGLPLYEWRWRMTMRHVSPRRSVQDYTRPLWLGKDDIAGKTLLIYLEQGLGDMIQFCRYAPLAAKAGAHVIIEVQPPLKTLMATLPGVSRVMTDGEVLPDYDLRIPMMSLPLAFATTGETIPADVPYLRADPTRVHAWRDRLSGLRGRRVGLVWGAGARVGDSELVALEHRKSVSLAELGPLAAVAGCAFVSIQLGPAAAQVKTPPEGMVLHDFTGDLHDFADTAALMENLDLIISVCTATAHLAGALGKPVWLLNRFDTDWRWFLDRDDSPWYPTMRIFRQPRPGDWASVARSVADALRAFATD